MPETANSVIYMNIRRKVRDAASRGNKFREAFIIRYDVVGNIVASVRENLYRGNISARNAVVSLCPAGLIPLP